MFSAVNTLKTEQGGKKESEEYLRELKLRLNDFKNTEKGITQEELNQYKLEKQKIIEERNYLKVALVRASNTNKGMKINQNGATHRAILAQIHELIDLIPDKQEELDRLMNSDLTSEIKEYEEESQQLYMEEMRLESERLDSISKANRSGQKCNFIKAKYGSSQLEKKKSLIKELESEISKKRMENNALRDAIEERKDKMEIKYPEEKRNELIDRINALKAQIANENQRIVDLDKTISYERMNINRVIYK